ncbi:MAG: PIN domain-containing protein [Deltaproteobacteria bacterium]|nr:PIN domain-containing protein [Deltaproteobacteria bacterium]
MDRVIIDTSAWIESFRPGGDQELKQMVKELILRNAVLLPGIIKSEVLRGAKSEGEFSMLKDLLSGLIYLPVEEDFGERVARFSFELFRKGLSVPLIDTYIALLAIEEDVPLLCRDKHFSWIADKTGLRLL